MYNKKKKLIIIKQNETKQTTTKKMRACKYRDLKQKQPRWWENMQELLVECEKGPPSHIYTIPRAGPETAETQQRE